MRAGAYQYRCRGSRRQTGPAGWGKSGGGGGGAACFEWCDGQTDQGRLVIAGWGVN